MLKFLMLVFQKSPSRRDYCLSLLLFALFVISGNQLSIYSQSRKVSNSSLIDAAYAFNLEKFLQNNKLFRPGNTLDPDDPNDAEHWLAGSYYSTENGLTALLLLNNKGITPLSIQPTLYSKNGQQMELPPVIVDASSFRYINLNDWISLGGESFRQGNIRLFHTGKDLVLGAQIYLINEANSLSFEEKLSELGKFDSRRLEGILPIPSKQANAKVVLTNTSSDNLTVTGRLTLIPDTTYGPQSITLAPHETRVLDLRNDIPNGGAAFSGKAVAFSLEHNGAKWALLARAFVAETSTGYSNLAQFYNPLTGLMNEYHGAGIQMKSPSGTRLKPVVILRNTGSEIATVTGQVPYTRVNGTTGSITIPAIQLNPNEIKVLNTSAIEQRNTQENIKFAGIEIKYNTAPGSVGVAVHSESQDRNFVSRVPLWDPLRQRTATGGYPWLIEGTSVTKSYIKNITDRPQKYVAFFIWENNGMYMLGQKELAPHQSIEIDVKQLRDEQVPDENGNTIPQNISRGQFQWTLRSEEGVTPEQDPLVELALIGRSEQIDWGRKISNNYACQNCCMGTTVGSHLSPTSATLEGTQQVTIHAYLEQETCFGLPYSVEETNVAWSSNNTNVATVSGGTVTPQGAGSASINAIYQGQRFVSMPPCHPGDGPYLAGCSEGEFGKTSYAGRNKNRENTDQLSPGCGECFTAGYYNANRSAAITVNPHITEVNPAGLVPGQQNVYVRISGTNFGQSPTINAGAGVTAVYDIQTPDGFDARFSVDENAQVGTRQLTVTSNGRTSNAVDFTIGDRTPVITSISRSQGSAGQTFNVTIEGQHFGVGPLITFSRPGISYAINQASTTTTHIEATFTILDNAEPGVRDIKVISRGITGTGFIQTPQQSDTSNGVPFDVATVEPRISQDVDLIEKNGTKDVVLSFVAGSHPQNGETVKIKIEKASGTTGQAVFVSNNSTEETYTGSGGATQTFQIKGVTESNQINNFTIKAEVNGTDKGTTEEFTVAVISALEFERINPTGTNRDEPLDNNPGVDGNHTAGEGLRIFPDKNSPGDSIDRGILRVKATISPASVPNLKVYFASFDLDDPALTTPIDSNANKGQDNYPSTLKAGTFPIPTGGTCTNSNNGTTPTFISTITCPVSNNTASTNFKVTMQPGDNFAIAASLDSTYRDGIRVNDLDGSKLINGAGGIIPINGSSNPDSIQGIRTDMLTVWRKLRVEVDSLGIVSGNAITSGHFANTQRVTNGTKTLAVNVTPPLITNQFENGRAIINTQPYRVVDSDFRATPPTTSNTGNTFTIFNNHGSFNITAGDSFTLYDDDDFNDDDTVNGVDGDDGNEDIPPPNTTMMQNTDVVCTATVDTNCNVFGPAYIKPYYDGVTGSGTELPFTEYTPNSTRGNIYTQYYYNHTAGTGGTSANTADYWVVYLLGTYQKEEAEDGDPDEEGATYGEVDSLLGVGAFVYLELARPTEYAALDFPVFNHPGIPGWASRPVNNKYTTVHEIGHLLNGSHNDCDGAGACNTSTNDSGIMAGSSFRLRKILTDTSISRMRNITLP